MKRASSRPWRLRSRRAALVLPALLVLVGCGGEAPGPTFVEHEVTLPSWRHEAGRSSAERFAAATAGLPGGGDGADHEHHEHDGHDHGGSGDDATPAMPSFDHALPEGWEALPPTAFRLVNLRVAATPSAECTVSVAGGLAADNLDRWRDQFGLAAEGQAGFDARPEIVVLGRSARFIELSGSYTSMDGRANPGFALLGAILPLMGDQLLFVKMVGPSEVLAAERERFLAFLASLAPKAKAAPPPAAAAAAAAPAAFDPSRLEYTMPASWRPGRGAPMRLVTFAAGAEDQVTITLVALAGDGGGLAANVDMWRQQVGLPPADAAALAGLPGVALLGETRPLVEVSGSHVPKGSGAATTAEAAPWRVLATFAPVGDQTLFIKMSGPDALVAAERDAFIEFCRTMTY